MFIRGSSILRLMVLVAPAAIHQLRQRLGAPFVQWDATHLARNLFEGLEGDVRVEQQTIAATPLELMNIMIRSAF